MSSCPIPNGIHLCQQAETGKAALAVFPGLTEAELGQLSQFAAKRNEKHSYYVDLYLEGQHLAGFAISHQKVKDVTHKLRIAARNRIKLITTERN